MKAKFLVPFLLLLIGCNTGNKPLSEAQKEAVKNDAAPFVKEFLDALTVNDTSKVFALMEDSPEMTAINYAGIFGYSDMRKIGGQFFSVVEKQTFEVKSEKYSVISPSCLVYTWYGKNVVYIKGGEPIVYDDLMGSFLFKKKGSNWKIAYMHESSKMPEVADPVKEFTKIEEEWCTAMQNKDRKALESIYADEYMYISSKGKIYNKEQDISEIVGPAYKVLAPFKLSDINVKMYGTVAIVTGVTTSQSILDGKDISGSHNFMDIFTYRDGRWQCILSQPMPKPGK